MILAFPLWQPSSQPWQARILGGHFYDGVRGFARGLLYGAFWFSPGSSAPRKARLGWEGRAEFRSQWNALCFAVAGEILASANETYFGNISVRDHMDRGGGIWPARLVPL